MDKKLLYVIAPISNPVRYSTRYKLFRDFAARMESAGVNLYVVELAFGARPFEVTAPNNLKHIQLRTSDEIWHKENMVNLAISKLPSSWQYVAWVDGDIDFLRPDWAAETVQQLQHYSVVQMWQTAIDMGPSGQALSKFHSATWAYLAGVPYSLGHQSYYGGDGVYWPLDSPGRPVERL